MCVLRVCRFLLILLPLVIPASAQEHQHAAPEKLGKVHFPVTCTAKAQQQFQRAVALLHSFVYSSAEQAFREVATADPQCAMAHWGVAMSYYHQLWEPPATASGLAAGQKEIEEAQRLGASARERQYIDALASFYHDHATVPHREQALRYEQAMAEVERKNPGDHEARIFYALSLLGTALPTDKTHANQKRAAELLEPLFREYPQHPGLAHYLIHAYDSAELARRGVGPARAYSAIAPSAPHALHMPSHIFTRLGMWDDSIASNQAARRAARRLGDTGEELHTMDYMVYALLQREKYAEAAAILDELKAMPGLHLAQFKVGYAATAMPVRYALERRQWKEAMTLPDANGAALQVAAIPVWARALAFAHLGKGEAAQAEAAKLEKLRDQLRTAGNEYWAAQVDVQVREAEGWIAHAQGRNEQAVTLMRSAADLEDSAEKLPVTPGPIIPAREQLGDLMSELQRPADALLAYQTSLKLSPGRRAGIMGASLAAKQASRAAAAER